MPLTEWTITRLTKDEFLSLTWSMKSEAKDCTKIEPGKREENLEKAFHKSAFTRTEENSFLV